jgi:hypothetical protein
MSGWVSGEELLPFNLHQVLGDAIVKPHVKAGLLRKADRKMLDLHELTPAERRVLLRVPDCDDLPHFAFRLEQEWARYKKRHPQDEATAQPRTPASKSA